MTRTQVNNLLYGLVCLVVAVNAETGFVQIFPDSWKHYLSAAAVVAMYLKSHWNFWVNPNGTPAQVAYDAKAGK